MGNTVQSDQIHKIELQQQARHSNLSLSQVQNLWQLFNRLSKSKLHDGVIDQQQYMSLFSSKNQFNHRLFHVIDRNKDGVLNFREWVEGFSRFKAKTNNSKVMLAFEILADRREVGTREGIVGLMNGMVQELGLGLTVQEIEAIMAEGGEQHSELTCEALRKHIESHPQILEWMYYELQ